MVRLPQTRARDLMKILKKMGFAERTTKSSHRVFIHADGRRTVVPVHNEPLRKGTLRAIMKQAGLELKDL